MYSEITTLLENHFNSVATANSLVVIFDNMYTNPELDKETIRLNDIGGPTRLIAGTKQSGTYRTDGIYIIEVYTPIGIGPKNNDDICTIIFDSFVEFVHEKLKLLRITKQRVGEANNLYQQNIVIAYQYDKCVVAN